MKTTAWLVCAVSAQIAACPALAAKWESCGTARDGARIFYSPQSIANDRGMAKVWERTLGTRADMAQGIFEARRLTEFDCARHRYRAVLTVTYPADKALPITISDDENDWSDIPSGSPAATLHGIVCSDRPQQRSPLSAAPLAQGEDPPP